MGDLKPYLFLGLLFNALAILLQSAWVRLFMQTPLVSCFRFRRHLVKVEYGTGGGLWQRGGNSAESSSLRL